MGLKIMKFEKWQQRCSKSLKNIGTLCMFLCPLLYPGSEATATAEIEKYKRLLYDLVKKYQSRSPQSNGASQAPNPSSSRVSVLKLDLVKQLDVFVSHSAVSTHVKSELDHYLEESLLPINDYTNFDILCWWNSNGIKYPTLQEIARDILAIPVSTVASESCFSTSGRVISSHRSRLHAKTIEALMCARDWLWSEIRVSNPEDSKITTVQDDVECNVSDEDPSKEEENITLLE
uniref:zinc finger BED domain-containing protein RICESLEEPER 2-like n=1 Tax=Fragaria vesca subsp. vesca TaxID=101020 RepID=UPI0005C824D8|nr:PREDICTED: zinc finger BED domain-containing protein RICESLEEPER 2-like [Fragaria vesca subsp. vesca]